MRSDRDIDSSIYDQNIPRLRAGKFLSGLYSGGVRAARPGVPSCRMEGGRQVRNPEHLIYTCQL